jgi:hypothetical protein
MQANVNHASCYPTSSCLFAFRSSYAFFFSVTVERLIPYQTLNNYKITLFCGECRSSAVGCCLVLGSRSCSPNLVVCDVFHEFNDYNQFKVGFIKAFRNSVTQPNVHTSIYHDRYNKQSCSSWSAHFLNYHVSASQFIIIYFNCKWGFTWWQW